MKRDERDELGIVRLRIKIANKAMRKAIEDYKKDLIKLTTKYNEKINSTLEMQFRWFEELEHALAKESKYPQKKNKK